MQDTINQTLVYPSIDERFCNPVCRFDEEEIIGFIEVLPDLIYDDANSHRINASLSNNTKNFKNPIAIYSSSIADKYISLLYVAIK